MQKIIVKHAVKPGLEDLFNVTKLLLKNGPVLCNIIEKLKKGKELKHVWFREQMITEWISRFLGEDECT